MNTRTIFDKIMKPASYIYERKYMTDNIEDEECDLRYWEKILFPGYFDHDINEMQHISLTENIYEVQSSFEYLYEFFEDIIEYIPSKMNKHYDNIMFGAYYERITENAIKAMKKKWGLNEVFFLSEEIVGSFRKHLAHRLSYITNRTLIQEMYILKQKGGLNGNSSKEEYEDYNENYLTNIEYLLKIYDIYPVLLRITLEQMWKMIENFLEVFLRLYNDRKQIEKELCNNSPFSKVMSVDFGKSDFHNGGKSVYIIGLDNGTKVVYKPHSILCEKFHNEAYSYLLKGIGMDSIKYNIIEKENYGWEKCFVRTQCCTTNEIGRYYERFGVLVFLNYILHSGDLHYENLMAVGEFPVLIDCETILCNQFHVLKQDTAVSSIQDDLSKSILFSGLLPQNITGDKEKPSVNVSAISGEEGQELSIKVPMIVEPFTSNAKVEYINPKTTAGFNLPLYKGEIILPKNYLVEIQLGFSLAYNFIIGEKVDFLKFCVYYSSIKLRFLFRNTQQYSMLLNLSFHPDFLQNGRDRELLMGVLYKRINMNSTAESNIAKFEKLDLLNGDIPYFGFISDGLDLCHNTGIIKSFFVQNSIVNFKRTIAELNSEDLMRQKLYLRLLFTKYSLPEFNKVTKIKPMKAHRRDLHIFLEAANEIAVELLRKAKYNHAKTDVNWLQITVEDNMDGIWSFEPLDMYLYNGLVGVLIFLCALKKLEPCSKYDVLISLLNKKYFDYTDDFIFKKTNATSYNGAFFGEASLVYAYALLYKITDNTIYYQYAKKHCDIVDQLIKGTEWDKHYDILLGSAGCILVYINMYTISEDANYLIKASTLGEALIEKNENVQEGIAWKSSFEDFPLTGFSHGACGMAYMFLKLWKFTGNHKFLDVSHKATLYENSQFDEVLGTWKDLRRIRKVRKDSYTSAAWCHGASGILLGRMRMYEIAPENMKAILKKDCERGLKYVIRSGAFANNCLCHGNSGNLEILVEYIRLFNISKLEFVEDDFFILAKSVREKNWNCQLPQAYENPGLMTGIAGIGYALLRQYNVTLPEIISVSL